MGKRAALAIASCFLVACGGGIGAATDDNGKSLTVRKFDAARRTDVRLDEPLTFRLSGEIRPGAVGPTRFVIEPEGGGPAARGVFVRGTLLRDQDTGGVVIVDPDQLGPRLIDKIGDRARVDLVPRSIRYDLGGWSDLNGNRQVLFDRSKKDVVTFLPEPPALADLSDAGLEPGTKYRVRIKLPGGEAFKSTFTTVAADAPAPFSVPEACASPIPVNGESMVRVDQRIHIRFSDPVDPRTVNAGNIVLERVPADPPAVIPCTYEVWQTRVGLVEVVVTPDADLAADRFYTVSVGPGLRRLDGASFAPGSLWRFSFTTGFGEGGHPINEEFTTNAMENAAATTADWNGSVPGALVAAPGAGHESVAESDWYDQVIPTPIYGSPEANMDASGGGIEILFQAASEDPAYPGQPVDPDADPARGRTTDWLPATDMRVFYYYQYLRFRFVFRNPADWREGDPLPTVWSIFIAVDLY